jgi:hypothetical protein
VRITIGISIGGACCERRAANAMAARAVCQIPGPLSAPSGQYSCFLFRLHEGHLNELVLLACGIAEHNVDVEM